MCVYEKWGTISHPAETDISFQAVHAVYTLERILHDIARRSESFEIVFWHGMHLHIIVW